MGEEDVSRLFSGYRPAKDSSVDDFLASKAVMMEKKQECRTYVAVDVEQGRMLGFFTLAMRCLEIPDECGLSNSMMRKLNRSEEKVSQAYLLGQLSRSEDVKGFGRVLIDEALARIREANAIIGCRLVRLDCTDELVPYYEGIGFHPVKKNRAGTLNQMVMLLRRLRRGFFGDARRRSGALPPSVVPHPRSGESEPSPLVQEKDGEEEDPSGNERDENGAQARPLVDVLRQTADEPHRHDRQPHYRQAVFGFLLVLWHPTVLKKGRGNPADVFTRSPRRPLRRGRSSGWSRCRSGRSSWPCTPR